jgi:uncharacterized protein (TIGR02300 family)
LISLDTARGTKRSCQACQARYYDLGREPVCPKCGVAYIEPPRALPTHRVRRARVPAVSPVSAPAAEVDAPVMDGGSAEVANVVADDDEEGDEAKSEETEDTEEAEKET